MKGFCRYIYQFSLWHTIETEPRNKLISQNLIDCTILQVKFKSKTNGCLLQWWILWHLHLFSFLKIIEILNFCDSIVATQSAIHLLISHFVWIWIRVQAILKSSTTIQFYFETLRHRFQFFIGIISLNANKSQTFRYWISVVWKNIIIVNIPLL